MSKKIFDTKTSGDFDEWDVNDVVIWLVEQLRVLDNKKKRIIVEVIDD